ncbi:MAG: TraB/GumN family protein [Desulfobulbaceae bacterium]|nr:TraB/GumN family protein [Desulfobulbaceae bacterium]
MKIKIFIYLLFLCPLIFNVSAFARSPVWKISKDGKHLFLGGTIHLLSSSDYPLPASFDEAYNNSTLLVLEVDLQEFQVHNFQQKMLQDTMYSGQSNISSFLKPDTLLTLKAYLESRGIPEEPMLKLKPGMLSITLTLAELQRLGMGETGVDDHFNFRALDEKRKIKYLETPDDQLEFISKMGEGNENEFIEYILSDLNNLAQLFDSMKNAWKNGDIKKLQKVGLDPWVSRFPDIYNSLLIERNKNWIPQIETMIETKKVEFILFGALHLVGEDGILKQLKTLGYEIENL